MFKKSKMSLAIAGVTLMSLAGTSAALAADRPLPTRIVPQASASANDALLSDRFVVKYKAGAPERTNAAAAQRVLGNAAARAGLDRAVGATATSSARSAATARLDRRLSVPGWSLVTTSRHLNPAEADEFIRVLKSDPSVDTVEQDRLYVRMNTWVPDDSRYADLQWHLHSATGGIRAPQAWALPNSRGAGVVVAILDTGIVQNHLDLAANVIPGYDMLSHPTVSRREEGVRIPGGWDTGDWAEAGRCGAGQPADTSSWHGSHVGGTVAQETNNALGGAGVAFESQVQPVRVLGACGGTGVDIADGITWASGGTVAGVPNNATPAHILNLSLGSRSPSACSALYQDAINAANARGSIIVVAAGNGNANAGNYTMSSCQNVISVGANGIAGGRAGYSNWGARVDIAAPGGGGGADGNPNGYVWQVINAGSQAPTGEWQMGGMAGTSMASPHVAGVAAMVQGALAAADRPLLSWTQMRDLLTETARPFPVNIPASTPIGAGIVDAHAALVKALEEPCDPEVEECGIPATPLTNRVPVRGLSGNAGSEVVYSFEATAGRMVSFATSGGTGNVQMYVSFDAEPSAGSADFSSARPGNNEAVRINAAQVRAGTYYIKLVGAAAYSGVTLEARQ